MTLAATREAIEKHLDPIYKKRVDENYCEKIARVFSRNYGIRVVFGQGAHTDAKSSITLPAMYCERWILDGVLDHECGHVRRERKSERARVDGPIKLLEKANELAKAEPKYRALPLFLNAVEDCSIETEDAETWPGVAINLERSRAFMIKRLEEEGHGLTFSDAVGKAFVAETMGPSLLGCSNEGLAAAASWVNENLSEFIPRAREARWTEESFEIAQAICNRLDEKLDEATKAKDREELEKMAAAAAMGEDGDGSGEMIEIEMTPEEAEKFIEEMKKLGKVKKGEGTFEAELRKHAEKERREVYAASPAALAADQVDIPQKDKDRYRRLEKKADKITRALMARLRLVLLSNDVTTEYGLKKGKIHSPHLHRLANFNTKVFQQESAHTVGVQDTAVAILIDQSGSMGRVAMDPTISAVIALSKALDTIGIKFEITGFSNEGDYKTVSGVHYHRTLPFVFSVFKSFNGSWTHEKERLGSCRARHENADGEAIEFAAKRLLERPETRKILFVLSDGQPYCGGDDNPVLTYHLKKIINWIEKKKDVEIVGVGLGYSGVREYYKHSAVADTLDKLPGKLYQALRRSMGK